MESHLPLFYLNTAADVIAIPEPVSVAGGGSGGAIEPHSCRIFLVSAPSLIPSTQRAVITLMMLDTPLQSRVVADGEVISFSAALYSDTIIADEGTIFVKGGDRRADILRRINTPDYRVVTLGEGEEPPANVRRSVHIMDGAMLKIPVREVVRQFSTIFSSASTIISPSVATFKNFRRLMGIPLATSNSSSMGTTFISLGMASHISLSLPPPPPLSLMAGIVSAAPIYQPPIKMTSASWTVFGVLWFILAVLFLVSVGVTYGWYISQYL